MPRDRHPVGKYVCDQNLHVSGGDCPHCVPYKPPEPSPRPAAPGPDRALELLRELCELDGERIDGPWLAAFADIRARARGLVEGAP